MTGLVIDSTDACLAWRVVMLLALQWNSSLAAAFHRVTDMVGGGPFRLKPGEWTDDTSMALCLASSLVEQGKFDPLDQMERYLRWFDEGYLSSNGHCFDIGNTVRGALSRFRHSRQPFSGSTDPGSAGNGCIMRLAPVPMFFFPERTAAIEMSAESSRTTHGTAECIDSASLFGGILWQALSGSSKTDVILGHGVDQLASRRVVSIARGRVSIKERAGDSRLGLCSRLPRSGALVL